MDTGIAGFFGGKGIDKTEHPCYNNANKKERVFTSPNGGTVSLIRDMRIFSGHFVEQAFLHEGGVRLTDEEKVFAEVFARTLSVKTAQGAAGFAGRTAYAKARTLMERGDVREYIRGLIADEAASAAPSAARSDVSSESSESYSSDASPDSAAGAAADETEERILREYEKIAFADTSDGDIKVSDKLRALDQYRAIIDRRNGRSESDGAGLTMVVNYDYGERE